MDLQTKNLKLVPPHTLEDVRAMIDAMDPAEKAQMSADWLEMLNNATSIDPWIHGFSIVLRSSDSVVGQAGFKGPPTADGIVEIAYGIAPDHQGKGYAKACVSAVTAYAVDRDLVPLYNTQGDNVASQCVARAVGYQEYLRYVQVR